MKSDLEKMIEAEQTAEIAALNTKCNELLSALKLIQSACVDMQYVLGVVRTAIEKAEAT